MISWHPKRGLTVCPPTPESSVPLATTTGNETATAFMAMAHTAPSLLDSHPIPASLSHPCSASYDEPLLHETFPCRARLSHVQTFKISKT